MKIGEIYETQYGRVVKVQPFPHTHFHIEITVMQNMELFEDYWKEASVNWPAIGSVVAEHAEKFAEALAEASKIAKAWTEERCSK